MEIEQTVQSEAVVPEPEPIAESCADANAEATEGLPQRKQRRQKRLQKRFNMERDIRYRGPLSYRWFRIFAWLCMASGVVLMLLNVAITLEPASAELFGILPKALEYVRELALPFFLLATFSVILSHQGSYLKPLVRYAACSAAVVLVYLFAYEHYLVGFLAILAGDRAGARDAMQYLFRLLSGGRGFLSFNVFIDLFLCTLFMFMINYRSEKRPHGFGEKLVRTLSVLPILYEIASILLKALSSFGKIDLPLWTFPLLTTKPPMTFVAFMAMAIFINRREHRLQRYGSGDADYQAFLQTNRNSLHFSLFSAVVLLVAGLLDLLFAIFSTYYLSKIGGEMEIILNKIVTWGIGGSISLIFLAPLMLLFSYTRTHKNKLVDTVIPIAGIALMAIIFIEGVFQGTMVLKDELPKAVEIASIIFRAGMQILREIFP